jgi:N-methylhydantoinase B
VTLVVEPGQKILGHDGSGGGYGDPLHRDPDRVLFDVIEGWESVKRAEQIYGVVVTEQSGVQLIDESKASALRASSAKQRE